MVTSPFHFFSRTNNNDDAEDPEIISSDTLSSDTLDLTIGGNMGGNWTVLNPATGESVNSINIQSIDSSFDYYGGCRECYQFSMLFGRTSNNIGVISNEEDFEKYKMQFVAHFNEKHRDLYEWRKNGKKGKKPITNKEEIERRSKLLSSATSLSFNVLDSNTLNIPQSATLYYSGEPMQLITPPLSPVMSQRDHSIIGRLERTGHISERDRKRLDKKYGKSVVIKALKKYSRTRQVRTDSIYGTDIIRGWRT